MWVCICACVHMSVCTCAHDLLVSAQKLEDRHAVCCVCVCLHMNVCTYICGVYLACVYSVGAVRQSSGVTLPDTNISPHAPSTLHRDHLADVSIMIQSTASWQKASSRWIAGARMCVCMYVHTCLCVCMLLCGVWGVCACACRCDAVCICKCECECVYVHMST